MKNSGKSWKYVMVDEADKSGDSMAEAAEQVWAGGGGVGRGRSGHGLEVSPSGLLHEVVADGDLVAGGGGGGGVDGGGGGGRKHVSEGCVG